MKLIEAIAGLWVVAALVIVTWDAFVEGPIRLICRIFNLKK